MASGFEQQEKAISAFYNLGFQMKGQSSDPSLSPTSCVSPVCLRWFQRRVSNYLKHSRPDLIACL